MVVIDYSIIIFENPKGNDLCDDKIMIKDDAGHQDMDELKIMT